MTGAQITQRIRLDSNDTDFTMKKIALFILISAGSRYILNTHKISNRSVFIMPRPKDSWITVALDGSVSDDKIKMLLDMSYEATAPKTRKKKC